MKTSRYTEAQIIEDDLWHKVRARQGALKSKDTPVPVWDRRRPKTLFSGLCEGRIAQKDSRGAEPRWHPRPAGWPLGWLDDQWQSRAWHWYPEQRAVYRATNLEPPALCQRPRDGQTRLAVEPRERLGDHGNSGPPDHRG